jgi:16S rRNA (cytosine967-C5)-methyltransferase
MSEPRAVVARALGVAAARFPNLPPLSLDVSKLDGVDRSLAVAIHRAAVQRWITLEYLLDQHLKKPMHSLEPTLRGVLLSAAAQLVLFDRLPSHAVVDESVSLSRRLVRPGAAGLVNAVLRRLSQMTEIPLPDQRNPVAYLSTVTSHGRPLVEQWINTYGQAQASRLCCHGVQTPPTWVVVEPDCDCPQEIPGFIQWQDTHEQLIEFIAGHAHRRVQDPASVMPVKATASLQPRVIIDYCAGKGTKTRQTAVMHTQAKVLAHDVDQDAMKLLKNDLKDLPNVDLLPQYNRPKADLLILDVPCSNTAALARRPEAKYRFNKTTLKSVINLQRRIMQKALDLMSPQGFILYCTCSLEPQENHQQAAWLAKQCGAVVAVEQLTFPSSRGQTYHDGSYFALLSLNGSVNRLQ